MNYIVDKKIKNNLTILCSKCKINQLGYSISTDEYFIDNYFYDNWICTDCNIVENKKSNIKIK